MCRRKTEFFLSFVILVNVIMKRRTQFPRTLYFKHANNEFEFFMIIIHSGKTFLNHFFLLLFNLIRETREVKTSKKNKKSFVNKK